MTVIPTAQRQKATDFLELVEQTKRGKLRTYLGFAAGVGKTYRILKEAHTLKNRGVDIVIGYVEPHGRQETWELIEGLEVIPRKQYEYRGIVVEEMDLDGVLTRHPRIAIVDEVAHTNVPLCKNRKRWQDIIDLLDAGINVICAFNVQHLESLNELVSNVADTKIRETIPDAFLKQADQIITIDLTVEDLLLRLQEGKIYESEKIPWAQEHFFKPGNLDTLRELTLREVAESLERVSSKKLQSDQIAKKQRASERVMVCITSASPHAETLLYRGYRMAGRLNTHWFVVNVETPHESPINIDAASQRHLIITMNKAKELGAEFVRLHDKDAVAAITDFARSHAVKHIILGRSVQPWWKHFMGRSFTFQLLKEAHEFDVHIVSFEDKRTQE